MGRKTVRSGDPAEKTDRDILEVLVALPPESVVLPIGLRVTVRFMAKQQSPHSAYTCLKVVFTVRGKS